MSTHSAAQSVIAQPGENPYAPLDAAHQELVADFAALPGYRELAIAPEFVRVEGSYGHKAMLWEAQAFAATGVEYGRVVRVSSDDGWINNIVVFPAAGYTTPILSLEMLGFRHRMHLIVADLFPVSAGDVALMDEIASAEQFTGDEPEMSERTSRMFSRSPIYRKPGTAAAIQTAATALRTVGGLWLNHARAAVPEPDPATAQAAVKSCHEYCRIHCDDEPAFPFLSRTFGEDLGKRLINELLFPTAHWRSVVNPS